MPETHKTHGDRNLRAADQPDGDDRRRDVPIFKVKVRSVTIYESHILVAADDEAAARRFLHRTQEWKSDASLDCNEAGTYTDDKIPVELNEINCIGEAPKGWNRETIPWNSQEELGELLPQ